MTSDGSHTLFVTEMDEHYHSVHGAIQESNFIFITSGLNYSKNDNVRIFEVGFGTGLNAFLTCINVIGQNKEIIYTTIDINPLPHSIIGSLNYKDLVKSEGRQIFESIHSCVWNKPVKISDNFTLCKMKGDITRDKINGNYNLIYFDAFGPDKQPEMWSDDIFRKIAKVTEEGGILVTYSAKGIVKRILCKNGFEVSLLPGPPGKRQIIRAVKI